MSFIKSYQQGVYPDTSYAGQSDWWIDNGTGKYTDNFFIVINYPGVTVCTGFMKWVIPLVNVEVLSATITLDVSSDKPIYYKEYPSGSTALCTFPNGGGIGIQTESLNASGITLLQDWIDKTKVNNGFLLTGEGVIAEAYGVRYATKESRPKLTITYQNKPNTSACQVS
jgi:hypothetical protein